MMRMIDENDPNETCKFRTNFVPEWTSFPNLIQVVRSSRARGRGLYIHIYLYSRSVTIDETHVDNMI